MRFTNVIFVNYKTYEKGTGANAIHLSRVLEAVSREVGIKIIPVVQSSDIKEVVSEVTIPVWAQNVDPVGYGAHTGSTTVEAVKEDGAEGTFLNHSERRFEEFKELEVAVQRAHGAGLKTLIFAANTSELKKIVKLKPTFLSYEPPELVGSKTTSVAQVKPEIISEAVALAKKSELPLIVGAGIKSADDVRKSLELGAVGIAVASSVVSGEDPKKALLDLAEGYK